jgi:hypothetical protein
MPQLHLPLFPQGATEVTASLAFKREADQITYYHGSLPVFTHAADDLASFRMITASFALVAMSNKPKLHAYLGYRW